MKTYTPIYVRSREEAAARFEPHNWEKSHEENILCSQDMSQAGSSPEAVLEKWGVIRVRFVLANTLREAPIHDGLDPEMVRWCLNARVSDEPAHATDFTVDVPPQTMNAFLAAARDEFEHTGLFDVSHCEPHIDDYLGCVLAMHPDAIRRPSPRGQLWLAVDGWDCEPGKDGSGISAVDLALPHLGPVRIKRSEFMGVLKDEYLPGWAREALAARPAVELPPDRALARQLGAYNTTHCEPDSQAMDYEDKVLVLPLRSLPDGCQRAEYQLWYGDYGMGCSPDSEGGRVRAVCLADGGTYRWRHSDFTGVLRKEFLPDWAAEKLAQLREVKREMQDTPAAFGQQMM